MDRTQYITHIAAYNWFIYGWATNGADVLGPILMKQKEEITK